MMPARRHADAAAIFCRCREPRYPTDDAAAERAKSAVFFCARRRRYQMFSPITITSLAATQIIILRRRNMLSCLLCSLRFFRQLFLYAIAIVTAACSAMSCILMQARKQSAAILMIEMAERDTR